jgi:peptide/nickel transport system permease protein
MKDVVVRYARYPVGVPAFIVLVSIVGLAVAASWLYPAGPWRIVGPPNLPPLAPGHPLGTDTLGRDIAAGIAHGGRVSLLVGLVSTFCAVVIGTALGAIAGYHAGTVDDLLMRFTEFFQTIPGFLLAIVLVAVFMPSMYTIIGAIAAVSWPSVARLVRAEFLSLRHRDFVAAAVAIGESTPRIIFRHILPNALSSVVVAASLMVASAILLESAISFLGLGDRNRVSWGFMIGAGRAMVRQNWWLSAIPGFAIFLTVLALNLLGDALNFALNPRLTRTRG